MNQTKKLALSAIMTALTFVATYIIVIPLANGGYVHIGDSMVFLAGIIPGGIWGAFAAGLGSMLADMVLAPAWMIPTFIIKFLMALVVSSMTTKRYLTSWRTLVAIISACIVMNTGYFAAEWIIYGSVEAGVIGFLSAQMFQSLAGIILGYSFIVAVDKTKVIRKLYK